MWGTRVLSVVAVLAVAQQSATPPPQQSPTFRTGVALVTIDVTVLDADGKPVPGLTAGDLEIKLDGKAQPIRALAYVQAAPASAATPATAPAVAAPAVAAIAPSADGVRRTLSNTSSAVGLSEAAPAPAPAAPPAESRTFVLLVDDLSFSAGSGKRIFAAAERFLDRVPAADPVGFTTTTGIGALNPTTAPSCARRCRR